MRCTLLALVLLGCTPTTEPEPTCHDLMPVDSTRSLVAGDAQAQIHGASVAHAGGFDLVWSQVRTGSSRFDVAWQQLDCGLSPLAAPTLLNDPAAGRNDIDPSIARRGGASLVAWASDGAGTPNLRIDTAFIDGSPDPLRTLALTDGGPHDGNAWMTSVDDTDEGFVISGAYGVTVGASDLFQVFEQDLDPEGAPVGETSRPAEDPMDGQVEPLVIDRGADRVFAWARDDGQQVSYAVVDPADPNATVTSFAAAQIALGSGDEGTYAVAVRTGAGPGLTIADVDGTQTASEDRDAVVSRPGAAVLPDSLVVSWFERRTGNQSDLYLQVFEHGDPPVAMGEPILLTPDEPAAGYPADLHPLPPDRVWLTWSRGSGQDLVLVGRVVQLP